MNGPFTLIYAAACGIIRSLILNLNSHFDYVPVDDVIKSMVIASWKHGIVKDLYLKHLSLLLLTKINYLNN